MPSLSFLRPRKRTSPQGSDNKSPIPLSGDIRRMAKRISPPPASAAGAAGRNGRLIAHTPGLSSSSRSSMDEPPAPTIATGPASGEVAKKAILADSSAAQKARRRDRFRMFRSRSTQFRNELGENVDQGEARRSWTVGMTPQFRDDPAIGSQAQTRPRDSSPGNVKYGNATPTEMETTPVPVTAQQQQQRPREPRPRETRTQPRPRPNTIVIVGDDASPIEGNSSGSGGGSRLEKLKRLPSLSVSVKRGLSTRRKLSKKLETPQVIVTPATVISDSSLPNSAAISASPSFQQTTQSPPLGIIDHNKPLPPIPLDDDQRYGAASPTGSTASRPNLLRLNRIMATLSDLDIQKLFSGAPQYYARSEGHFSGAPHPSIAFPWNDELAIRDLTDHVQIEDAAWGCTTARPHITRDVLRGPSASATRKVAEKRRAHFYPRCRERPNMLSMQGLEKGTMGYQAALELSVADALQEEQWGFGSLGAKEGVIVDARKHLITSRDGLRRLEESTVLDHLIKNAQRYQEKHRKDRASCHELFQELFNQILHPPHRTFTDPFSLSVQISSLLKVLAAPNVWVDFSRVEWRIRLGQILWGTVDDDGEDSVSDGASITDAEETKELHEERYWLLLQILLACELLIRLDTITEGDEIPESVKPSEVLRFEREANGTVKWSLHLARAWLENIDITKSKPSTSGEQSQPKGWLANLTHRMSLTSDRPHSRHHDRHQDAHRQQSIYVMRGKHWERQVRGLTHFARRLKWPEIDKQSTLISENCRAVTEGTPLNTPLETPMSTLTAKSKDSSYFTLNHNKSTGRKSRRQKVGAALHPAGWLSKSYVSGLMLPGEGLYHFIMSTLLETDIVAMQKLGPMANLCGGFVYSGKSFWSTACVVGRVLAAGKGAVECMGWISSDVVPHNLNDGWVNIDVEDIAEDVKKTGKQARIWGKLALERESSVLGGSAPDSVFPADFIIPFENHYKSPPPTISVELKSLDLTIPLDSLQTTPTLEVGSPFSDSSTVPEIKTFTPSIKFNVTIWEDDEDREFTLSVAKDVYFVTAHPCVPSQHVRILKSPSSPTIQQIDLTGNPFPGNGNGNGSRSTSHAKITCHPLHKYYTYTAIHLSELLNKPDWSLEDLLENPSSNTSPRITPSSNNNRTPRVLVIDAITNFMPQPEAHEIPLSPVTSRASASFSEASSTPSRKSSLSANVEADNDSTGGSPMRLKRTDTGGGAAEQHMHSETRRRQFGSDMEILVRAICAEKGWNALISRRRRGCLACAIREAGALGWRVVVRVD